MDRRTTLAKLLGKTHSDNASKATTAMTMFSGLAPYTGPFEYEQAAHLLRRATFGATYQQVKSAVTNGLENTLENLFAIQAEPSAPVNVAFTDDPCTPIGETWVDKTYSPTIQGLRAYREQSLFAWTLNLIRTEGINIQEKMVLFWHNHFPVADIFDTRQYYTYSKLLRRFATGNFKELTKQMTIEPAMLRYLNGNENTANSPNENYARELLELFTIGKGPLVGPSDYTHYTEQDVVEIAKVMSGWRVMVNSSANPNNPACNLEVSVPQFVQSRHNSTTKQLSHRFNNEQIPNMGDQEYAHLIDIVFTKDECARFICRKLYRWFVYYEISQQVEDEVIVPMAQIMVDNGYEIRPALEALLRSEHFFDILNVGPMIKNPIDFAMGIYKVFDIDFTSANLLQLYRVLWKTYRPHLENMGMPYYDPPSVAGWKAYYQEPVYYRNWISAVTLPIRQNLTSIILNPTTQGNISQGNFFVKIDALKFAAGLDNPEIADSLIDGMVKALFPQPITPLQHDFLKDILLEGQPDYEWNVEYGAYLDDPNDQQLKDAIEGKLKEVLAAMLNMPEYYLS